MVMGWIIRGEFNEFINVHDPRITLKHSKQYTNDATDGVFSSISIDGHPSSNLLQIIITGFNKSIPDEIVNNTKNKFRLKFCYEHAI